MALMDCWLSKWYEWHAHALFRKIAAQFERDDVPGDLKQRQTQQIRQTNFNRLFMIN